MNQGMVFILQSNDFNQIGYSFVQHNNHSHNRTTNQARTSIPTEVNNAEVTPPIITFFEPINTILVFVLRVL